MQQIEEARQPYIEKNLKNYRKTFDKENASLSEMDREYKWNQVEENMRLEVDTDINSKLKKFWATAQGRLDGAIKLNPAFDKNATELLAESTQQGVNESKFNPLAIDRVTTDGPKDFVGELKETLKSGPVYDLNKPAMATVTEIEASAFEGRRIGEAKVTHQNPVDQILNEANGIRDQLEENYDYAKEVESSIESQRQKLADDILKLQKSLIRV